MHPKPAATRQPTELSPGTAPATAVAMCSALRHLVGESIVNRAGQKLGTVDDLLVNAASGRIAYVVMAWGGFMGRGERQLVLPWPALQHDAARGAYVLDADDQRLAAAPCINTEVWPEQPSREWHLAVHRHYGIPPNWH